MDALLDNRTTTRWLRYTADRFGFRGALQQRGAGAPQGLFRLVSIQTTDRRGKPQTIRLPSNLVDPQVGAQVIGSIYRLRWQIELFFKWLKTWPAWTTC